MTDENTAIEHIVTRTWEDEAFKQEFLSDPKPVIEQATGEKLPEGLIIRVMQETPNIRYLVLPLRDEVSAETLEQMRQGAEGELSSVIARALEDNAFKQELLSNPSSVIERELGITIPEGIEFRVVEQENNIRNLVLPMQPDNFVDGELSEEELEAVAGGIFNSRICCGRTVDFRTAIVATGGGRC